MRIIFSVLFVILYISCDVEEETTKTFIIENTLDDNTVKLEFYENGGLLLERTISVRGPGVLFNETVKSRTAQFLMAIKADSIVVTFDESSQEIHSITNQALIPIQNSLFETTFYKQTGDTYTYSIGVKNLDNAIPCNGSCK